MFSKWLNCCPIAHPEISPAVILTRSEFRSGNADWEDQNFAFPRGARRMNTWVMVWRRS